MGTAHLSRPTDKTKVRLRHQTSNSKEEMTTLELKVTRIETYYGPPMWQVMEAGTDEDAEVGENGEWRYCGALRGMGSSIAKAIDDFLDAINETVEEDIKYRWS